MRIRLKYINAFINRDRKNQRIRYYFRRRDTKAIPLPGLPGSEEFMAAYHAALAAMPDKFTDIGAGRTSPGTINALVVAYYKSASWNNLAPDTRKSRRRSIEGFRIQHGDKRIALLRRDHIEKMLAAIEKPSAKRGWLKAIRPLLQSAVPSMRRDDPTAGITSTSCLKARAITLGLMMRSSVTAPIGHSARNNDGDGVCVGNGLTQGRGRPAWPPACQKWPHSN
jgi:hypothetical protein